MSTPTLGQLLHAYFVDHLVALKGLRPTTIRSYRDTLRLFLVFAARDRGTAITCLKIEELTFERVLAFLRDMEEVRGNHPTTRNQRLAALHGFFDFLGQRAPELLHVCERVAAIPRKRAAAAEVRYLDRDQVTQMLANIPENARDAARDRTLLLFLYNTGARVQEAADLRRGQIDLDPSPRVRICGKGGKWRTCPLWDETARRLRDLVGGSDPQDPVFLGRTGRPLTRFGLYKIVRRLGHGFDAAGPRRGQRISPHVLRHTAAVHLLEAGVDVNVIRTWLGHAQLETTYRYAEITMRAKEEALRACEVIEIEPGSETSHRGPAWRNDQALLAWLAAL